MTSTFAAGVWTASGAKADVNALLAGVSFNPAADFNGSFTLATRVSDGVAPPVTGSKVFTGIAVVDRPVLADTALNLTVALNAGAPTGAVGSLLGSFTGGISDPDSGAVKGMAITATDEAHGAWYYSTDGGANWQTVGAVSTTSALLLADNANTRLYFAPVAGFTGSVPAGLTFHAWDQTSGTAGDRVNTVPVTTATSVVPITIPALGDASPFPATLNVAGVIGTILDVNVSLNGLSHTFPDDLDILLVGPQGQKLLLMSDVGGNPDLVSVNLTFDDAAAASLPDSTQIVSGSYKPTNIGGSDTFTGVAGPFDSLLSVFNGTDPNGDWRLYVVDDFSLDSGTLAGWSLTITTGNDVFSLLSLGSDSIDVTVAINVPPTLTGDRTATVNEGASVVIQAADLGFSDPDDNAAGVTFSVNTLVNGKIQVGGVDATSFTGTQLAAGQVSFVHDGSEAPSASFKVSVEDGNEDSSTPLAQTFNLTVTPVNDPPVVAVALPDQEAQGFEVFNFQFSATAFNDPDGDNLSYQAERAGGGPLPAWLSFNPATRTFSGTPGAGDAGSVDISVKATDPSAAAATDTFTLNVVLANRVYIDGSTSAGVRTLTANTTYLGPTPTNYAWYKNGTLIASGPAQTSITPVGAAEDFSLYQVVVSHSGGSAASSAVDPQAVTPTPGLGVVAGTPGANTLPGVPASPVALRGYHGADTLGGGAGADWLDGGEGNDSMTGGAGNDTYIVDSALDGVFEAAGGGLDTVLTYVDHTLGAELEKLILVGTAAINGTGNALDNMLTGNGAANQLRGGDGQDQLVGGAGNDTLMGQNGNDTVDGGDGDDYVEGNAGNDSLDGGLGADTLNGNEGADRLLGKGGNDSLVGGDGNDTLDGAAGNDALRAGAGDDSVLGGGGNDTLVGELGRDTLDGGAGKDLFVFDALPSAGNADTIMGFNAADDTIQLVRAAGYLALPAGALAAGAFVVGAAALDGGDRIIYNAGTGALLYDADGTGATPAVTIATLTGVVAAPTAADFSVV